MTYVTESGLQFLDCRDQLILTSKGLAALKLAENDARGHNGNIFDTTSLLIGLVEQGEAVSHRVRNVPLSQIVERIRETRVGITDKEPFSNQLIIDDTVTHAIKLAISLGYANDQFVGPLHLAQSLKWKKAGLHLAILSKLRYDPKFFFRTLHRWP